VVLAREGDRAAFSELVHLHAPSVRRLLARCCGDPALADDLAQEAFLRALADLPKLRDPKRFGAWLRKLALNIWLQHLRRRDLLRDATDGASEVIVEPAAGLARDLDRALDGLTPVLRTCAVLAFGEGLTHEEISRTTGLPLGTVKTHLRSASERLRAALAAYAGEEA